MNDIYEKQNTDELLQLQFAAKFNYNNASKINNYIWLCAICTGIFGIITVKDEMYSFIKNTLLILSPCLNYFLSSKIKYFTTLGASLKSYFDNLLFEFNQTKYFEKYSCRDLNEKTYDIIITNQILYNTLSKTSGTDNPRGIRNWYELISELDNTEKIYSCQKENVFWDYNLSKKYKKVLFTIITAILFLSYLFFKNLSLNNFSFLILSFLPLLAIIHRDIKNINNYKEISIKIENTIEIIDKINTNKMDLLIDLQNLINERRNLIYIIPDFIHKVNTLNLHKKWRALN